MGWHHATVSERADALRERAREALPPLEGEVRLNGLKEPVEVIRDRWGVPHIYARNLHDLWFAQGYVVASERLFQLDLMFRLSTGRLAEMISEIGLRTVIGLFVGIAIAFLIDYIDPSVRSRQEAETVLQLPVLGEIPRTRRGVAA